MKFKHAITEVDLKAQRGSFWGTMILLLVGISWSTLSVASTTSSAPSLPPVVASGPVNAACTLELTVEGVIGPATLDYLRRGLSQSTKWGCQSALLLINTPGGHLQSTRLIVEEIINSPIPFLCLVYPSGGHAGSAGAIILQACHLNGAMDATNIGAATPITGTGEDAPSDLRQKLINDTKSWLEGLSKLRERNEDFARQIVTEAKALDAREAQKVGAIDTVVSDKSSFLIWAQGRSVKVKGGLSVMAQVGPLKPFDRDLRFEVLELVADPEISYLMFMGSLGLLYFEITHPGMVVPGVLGGVGLVLSLIALHKLEVWWGGVALLFLGIGFIIGEVFVPSFGFLGISGIISFVTGSLLLFDPNSTGYQLSLFTILPTAIILGLLMFGLAWMALRTRRIKKSGGYEEQIGTTGVVMALNESPPPFNEEAGKSSSLPRAVTGQIEVRGEIWKFISNSSLKRGDEVIIESNEGLILKVKKKGD